MKENYTSRESMRRVAFQPSTFGFAKDKSGEKFAALK